jgi:hypothetical protein
MPAFYADLLVDLHAPQSHLAKIVILSIASSSLVIIILNAIFFSVM